MKIFANLFGRLGPILKGLGRVVQALMLISVFAMNLLMGYIMFAPDEWPKPFYLSYGGQAATTVIVQPGTGLNPAATTPQASTAPTPTATPVAGPGTGMMIDTGSKVVNLSDPTGRKYLRVDVVVEVIPPANVEAVLNATPAKGAATTSASDPLVTAFNDSINEKMPIINDTITTVLSSKTFDSIYTTDGKAALRDEIKAQLNQNLPEFKVDAIYFTEFVVQ